MDPKVADELLTEMLDKPVAVTDSIPQILNTQRPNIIFIILESFFYTLNGNDGRTAECSGEYG